MALDPLDDVDNVEQQAAGGSVGLDKLDPQAIAQAIGISRALADQQLAALVVAEEFLAEAPDRDQSVGSRTVERDEQAKARHRGDAAGERGADMARHIRCDITIHGAAFGRHGSALAHGKMLAGLLEAALVRLGQPAFAPPVSGGQGATYDPAGTAA